MKTSSTVVVLPTVSPRARRRARAARARVAALPILWRVVVLAGALALAQVSLHAVRSAASPGRSAEAPVAAGVAPSRPTAAIDLEGFRDADRCDLGGEPVECR